MLTFDEILLHIKFQLKLFLFACSPPSYKELFNVKSLRVRMSMERQFMLRTSESFQLCAISINDTVSVHVLLSVKLSMFHSLQSIHSLFSSFFYWDCTYLISQFSPSTHSTAHWTIECEKRHSTQNFVCMNGDCGRDTLINDFSLFIHSNAFVTIEFYIQSESISDNPPNSTTTYLFISVRSISMIWQLCVAVPSTVKFHAQYLVEIWIEV